MLDQLRKNVPESVALAAEPDELVCLPPEHRFARRKPMNIPALLRISGQADPVACKILDFSATGARVAFDQSNVTVRYLPLSGDCILIMPRDRAEVDCKIVWRRSMLMGFKFRSSVRHW